MLRPELSVLYLLFQAHNNLKSRYRYFRFTDEETKARVGGVGGDSIM